MKLQLATAALLVLAATSANAAKCKPSDQDETAAAAVGTVLIAAALVCDIKDPTDVASFLALKPCGNKDCVEAINAVAAVAPDCEDDAGENPHKKFMSITAACGAGAPPAKNETAPAATPAAPKAEASKAPAPSSSAPPKSAATTTTVVSMAAVGLSSVAWFAMA